ncbi:hypothetical protein K439DRAFT_1621045 [Ramaria rubella]|nr:hypothetical protein K439DRAFT_1621045 [Ramaria rubella]
MYDAFQEGIRGVSLTLSTPLGKKTITSHLSLIRLYVAVINHTSHVHLARAAFSRLNEAALISQEHIDAFGKECILATSPAFSTAASIPLWEFRTLTGENWLCDDILNSYGELAYFRHLTINPLREVQYLQLTTHFFQEAEPLYNQTPRLYSPNLIDICSRLCSSWFRGFGIKLWDKNHWSSYFYNRSNVLEHRDSLDRPPMPKVLDILNWVIDGIGIPSVEHFLTVSGPLQPGGSGSCGIIAHNFIENRMDPACALWTPVHAQQECDKWLRELVLYHLCSLGRGHFNDWTRPAPGAPDLKHNPPNAPIPETSFPYLDYNTLINITVITHPIFELFKLPQAVAPHMPPYSRKLLPPLELKKKDFTPVGRLAAIDTFNSSLCSQNAEYLHGIERSVIDLTNISESPERVHAHVLSSSSSDIRTWIHLFLIRENSGHTTLLHTQIKDKSPLTDLHMDKDLTPASPWGGSIKTPIVISDSPICKRRMHVKIKAEKIAGTRHGRSLPSGAPVVGTLYTSFEEAKIKLCMYEEKRGSKLRVAQNKKRPDGEVKRITLCCHAYGKHEPAHDAKIDPRDHCEARTVKCGCMVHYNLTAILGTSMWTLSFAICCGRTPRPASKAQCKVIETYATKPSFTRQHIKSVLTKEFPDQPLDSHQITNAINNARARARADVEQLGGDFTSIINNLQQKVANGEVWTYSLKLDDNGKVVGLWWQSPEQAALSRRYSDILINDNVANRNQYAREDANMHTWVLRNHLDAAGKHPDVFVSDCDPALMSVVPKLMPFTYQMFCLHHLEGNTTHALQPILRESWAQFKQEFWTVYHSISPEVFDTCWKALEQAYPAAKTYLNELFTCREHWAHPWTSQHFTAGVRTNGRVELYELFNLLNQRTQTQTKKEMTRVREATRRHHDDNLEVLFMKPLALLRAHVGPFALQMSYQEMKLSIYYRAEALQLPDGHRYWNAIQAEEVMGFEWKDGAEKHMRNVFCNDNSLISTAFLLRLITGQGFRIQHLLRIIHLGTSTAHTLAILDSGSYVCDCTMGTNLGINCRHYYCVLTRVSGMLFHIASIRRRWWQDPNTDPTSIPPVTLTHTVPEQRLGLCSHPIHVSQFSNPLEHGRAGPTLSPATQTVNSWTVIHEANAAVKSLAHSIQTQEQLDQLMTQLNAIGATRSQGLNPEPSIRDPPVPQHKGHPRTARLTSAIEGPQRGGGGKKRLYPIQVLQESQHDGLEENLVTNSPPCLRRCQNCCRLCGEAGHNRRHCYDVHRERQEDQERQRREDRNAARDLLYLSGFRALQSPTVVSSNPADDPDRCLDRVISSIVSYRETQVSEQAFAETPGFFSHGGFLDRLIPDLE